MADVAFNTPQVEEVKTKVVSPDVEAYPVAPTPEPQRELDGEVRGLSELVVTNVLVWIFGVIAIACLSAQLNGNWNDRTWEASFALIVAIVFLSITGILIILSSFFVPRWSARSIRRYLQFEVFYHFVAMVFWFVAATAVAVFITSNINTVYNYNVYWNLYYGAAEARAYAAFAYFASFAELGALFFAMFAVRDN